MPNDTAAVIVTTQPGALAPITSRAVLMRAQLDQETELRALVKEYIQRHMVEGVDYGKIPGTDKPTLLKPGAEKLVDLFRVEPSIEVVNRIEDWDRGLFHYEIKCELRERETRTLLAIGIGSANSREGRYRWRNGERRCPDCGAAAIIRGKAEYGGGFLCFKKKDGCGAKFGDKDERITEQPVGKVENDDIFTLVNTILKMAKKRALVDGAIALARVSDMFTQDVEDFVDAHGEDVKPRRDEQRGQDKVQAQQQSQPATKEQPRASVPSFSKSARWPHAEQWNGKPLDDAPLDTLIEYGVAVQKGIYDPALKNYQTALRKHLAEVELAIYKKEPKAEPAQTQAEPGGEPARAIDHAAADAIGERITAEREARS